jgi:cytochrome P450
VLHAVEQECSLTASAIRTRSATAKRAGDGSNSSLAAPRRFGKTSLLRRGASRGLKWRVAAPRVRGAKLAVMSGAAPSRSERFPIGATATLAELEGGDPHPLLARLRAHEPVSWVPVLDGWLVTRRDLALEVMRDDRTFTVDDPRFTTAQVVGPSMLSLDGSEHSRHRRPFASPFKLDEVRRRLAPQVRDEAERLVAELAPRGKAELRRDFAGPLAAGVVCGLLGVERTAVGSLLGVYDTIVGAVSDLSAGRAPGPEVEEAMLVLTDTLRPILRSGGRESLLATAAGDATGLEEHEIISNAAVLLFGGIETTEGMIANAVLHLLCEPQALELVRRDRTRLADAVEESLRLEPAAAAVDRFATTDARLGGAQIAAGDLVRLSIAAANRDPATFEEADTFDCGRDNARRHLAFAGGPHVCVAMHLAREEAHAALDVLLERLPGLRPDPQRPATVTGLIFRKPKSLEVLWDAPAA